MMQASQQQGPPAASLGLASTIQASQQQGPPAASLVVHDKHLRRNRRVQTAPQKPQSLAPMNSRGRPPRLLFPLAAVGKRARPSSSKTEPLGRAAAKRSLWVV